ncbi:hypothetical protein MDA_GLEAN10007531 [Myotis davidii]|uniref:Uncharacterized protein n=1 Tax=Myotis davidii TaxID=225400 RepID=L5LB97_MYODS|nr:hypothetical protein MDA_GLEAN10007531 [Myotis davidii]
MTAGAGRFGEGHHVVPLGRSEKQSERRRPHAEGLGRGQHQGAVPGPPQAVPFRQLRAAGSLEHSPAIFILAFVLQTLPAK